MTDEPTADGDGGGSASAADAGASTARGVGTGGGAAAFVSAGAAGRVLGNSVCPPVTRWLGHLVISELESAALRAGLASALGQVRDGRELRSVQRALSDAPLPAAELFVRREIAGRTSASR